MQMPPLYLGILRKETPKMLRCTCVRLTKMCSQKQLGGSKESRVELREKTNRGAVPTVASASHSRSSQVWKSSNAVLMEARSLGLCTAQQRLTTGCELFVQRGHNPEQGGLLHQRAILREGCSPEPSAVNTANHVGMST